MNATGEDAVRLLASMDASLKRLVAIAERRVTDRTQAARAPEVVPDSDLRRAVRQLDHPGSSPRPDPRPVGAAMIRLASGDIPKVVALRDPASSPHTTASSPGPTWASRLTCATSSTNSSKTCSASRQATEIDDAPTCS